MKDIYISFYKNCKSVNSEDILLEEWLLSDKYKDKILGIRRVKNEADQKILKADLPCATLSGLFSVRKASGLIKHSGYMCIDIDAADNPHILNFNNLRNEISKIINVAYASLSVRGNGVFCIIPIKYPEKHKEHFKAFQNDFKSLGIIIDKSCGDVSRLRFCSYDENRYYNKDAKIYTKYINSSINKSKLKFSKKRSIGGNYLNTHEKIERIVKKIEFTCTDITDGYDQWFSLGCSFAHELGEEGRDMFHRISQFSSKYDAVKTDIIFNSCISSKSNDPYTIGTFFFHASNCGIE